MPQFFRNSAALSLFLLMLTNSLAVLAQNNNAIASSPLRLSFAEGDVSFWRVGAPEWTAAQLNTPLAVGDALYVGQDGDLELQMDNRAFVRADDNTQLSLVNQTSDFIQFKVTTGRVSFDLRALPTGYSVEINTPNAVFTINRVGYYSVEVNGDVHFITRRGGRAIVVPAGGQAMSIHPSEEIVVQGNKSARAEAYVAPELDSWDRWNYVRTDSMVDTVSERYLPYGIAGASDLDHYGDWRVVPDYGPVWVPQAVPSGWAPYSTGRWGWDSYYQWTWIDDAPWGWAPFHYGRWVYLSGYWGWAPGPVVRHPVYAPALVAFFNVGPHLSVGIGSSGVGWVSLSWGEPVSPWWGQPSFVGRPWWGGWGGPRVVNNVVVRNTTVVNVTNITYNNTRVNNAVVATTHEHFGHGRVRDKPVRIDRILDLEHVRGKLPLKPEPTNLLGGAPSGTRPPESMTSRPVVSTRPAHEPKLPWRATDTSKRDKKVVPEQRYVATPRRPSKELPRPEYGDQAGAERTRSPLPPSFREGRQRAAEPSVTNNVVQERSRAVQIEPRVPRTAPTESPRVIREATPPRETQERSRKSQVSSEDVAAPISPRADLPGNSANRVYRDKDEAKSERRRAKQKLEN